MEGGTKALTSEGVAVEPVDLEPVAYDELDKDVIRAWVAARCDPYKDDVPEIPPELIWKTALTYVEAHERITGRAFEPPRPTPPVQDRVLAALGDFHGH